MKRLRVGVIYGGRSSEHEVSLASAASIIANLDRTRYEPVAIKIEKDGRWSIADRQPTTPSAADVIQQARLKAARPGRPTREVHLIAHPADETVLTIEREPAPIEAERGEQRAIVNGLSLDIIFPVVHGPHGEDGTLQGLLELANVPYVGPGVLASAVGMDKAVAKVLFAARGLPIVPYAVVMRSEWLADRSGTLARLERRLSFPMFVKPANLGSSIGITKAKDPQALEPALDLASEYDRKLLVEAAVPRAREIECGVLGNDQPEASIPGEIVPSREFYDYEAKYLDDRSQLLIPAPLSPGQAREVQRLAVEAFLAIDGAGMARVDFLLAAEMGQLYINEVNTIPGFTTIGMFAKLWEASGLACPALVDRLIHLAIERHAEKQKLRTSLIP